MSIEKKNQGRRLVAPDVADVPDDIIGIHGGLPVHPQVSAGEYTTADNTKPRTDASRTGRAAPQPFKRK